MKGLILLTKEKLIGHRYQIFWATSNPRVLLMRLFCMLPMQLTALLVMKKLIQKTFIQTFKNVFLIHVNYLVLIIEILLRFLNLSCPFMHLVWVCHSCTSQNLSPERESLVLDFADYVFSTTNKKLHHSKEPMQKNEGISTYWINTNINLQCL